ncbi:MAG: response regulator [Methanoregulaceae archaeon]|nr:response regulator [Methanoregulaceae archaeon]
MNKLGYRVFGKTKNEHDTLDSLMYEYPDLVMMDIILEGETDGIQLAKKILKKKDIPVVYVTGHTDDLTLERVRETSPSGFIIKPFSDDDLRVTIELAYNKK